MSPMWVYFDQSTALVNTRSLIFDGSTQYIYKLGNSSANEAAFTINFWLNRSALSTEQIIWMGVANPTDSYVVMQITSANVLRVFGFNSSVSVVDLIATNGTLSNTGSWHTLCLGVSTGQTATTDRVKAWYDGMAISFSGSQPALGSLLSVSANSVTSYIGQFATGTQRYSGLIDQFYYIDGQQLDYTYFDSATPGRPKNYEGSYTGVFDYYLDFEDNTSTTTLGTDNSGEGNNWSLQGMTTANSTTNVP